MKNLFATPKMKILGLLLLVTVVFLMMTKSQDYVAPEGAPASGSHARAFQPPPAQNLSASQNRGQKHLRKSKKNIHVSQASNTSAADDDLLFDVGQPDEGQGNLNTPDGIFDPAAQYSNAQMKMLRQELDFNTPSLNDLVDDDHIYQDWQALEGDPSRAQKIIAKWWDARGLVDRGALPADLIQGLAEQGYRFDVPGNKDLQEEGDQDNETQDDQTDPDDVENKEDDEEASPPKIKLPKDLKKVFDHIEPYQLKGGLGASYVFDVYSGKPEPLSDHLSKQSLAHLEKTYQFPPDWSSYANVIRPDKDKRDKDYMEVTRENAVLRLGKGGSVVFEMDRSVINNQPGTDFVIWGTPRCFHASKSVDKEGKRRAEAIPQGYDLRKHDPSEDKGKVTCRSSYAKVYVSNKGGKGPFYAIEPCRKGSASPGSHCAGFVINAPAKNYKGDGFAYGGDHFDISDARVKLSSINAIKIEDLGNNGRGGFKLDAWVPISVKYDKN